MRMDRAFVALAGLSLIGAAPAPDPSPMILDAARLDPALVIPPPPAPGSEQAVAELAELHAIERVTTARTRMEAQEDGKMKTVALFAAAVGLGFDLDRLPATAALFATVRREEKAAVDRAKAHFHRDRPWMVDASLNSCSRNDEPGSSYPSGHASMAFAMAGILARLLPQRAPAIMARASSYARERVLCEVHFPSDVAAGATFGTIIAERLMANPTSLIQFQAAARELQITHQTVN